MPGSLHHREKSVFWGLTAHGDVNRACWSTCSGLVSLKARHHVQPHRFGTPARISTRARVQPETIAAHTLHGRAI